MEKKLENKFPPKTKRIIELEPSNIKSQTYVIDYLIHAPGIAGGDMENAMERIKQLRNFSPLEANIQLFRYYIKDENINDAYKILNQLEKDRSKIGDFQKFKNRKTHRF